MTTGLDSLFCEALAPDQEASVRERLVAYRAALFERLLGRLQRPEIGQQLAAKHEQLQRFFLDMLALGDDQPQRFAALISDWLPTFLLARLDEGIAEPQRQQRLLDGLRAQLEGTAFAPPARAERWHLPCLDDMEALGLEPFVAQPDDPRYRPPEGWEPLPFAAGLDQAHEVLATLWPAVTAWVAALVPAFVDIGAPPSREVHRSASYGPGSPIFLSQVDTAFKHAEDIVHELQHERFHLLVDTSTIACWTDEEQRFVSPYRTDPRPLKGLVIGLHAFVAVNELRLRAVAAGWSADRVAKHLPKSHCLNLFAFHTLLEHEPFGGPSRRLFAEMAAALRHQHVRIADLFPATALETQQRALARHVARVAEGQSLRNTGAHYRAWDETAERAASYARDQGVEV